VARAVAALVVHDGSRVEYEYARDAWERWERGCGLITSRMCVSECGFVRPPVSRRCLDSECGGWEWFGVPDGLLLANRRALRGCVSS
jgi:hypothetical protein